MLRQVLPIVGSLILFTGCLKQSDPKGSSNQQKGAIAGTVIMRDWRGTGVKNPEGHIMAQFAKKTTAVAKMKMAVAYPEIGVALSSGSRLASTPAAMKCQVERAPIAKNSASAATVVSVGKMGFAAATQSTLTEMPEDNNHLYKHLLESGFPGGAYVVQGSGSADASPFGAKMSMPESLSHVIVAGQNLEVSATAFRKTDVLSVSWDAPTVAADLNMNQIEIEIMADTDKEALSLYCDVPEKLLVTDSKTVNLEIPPSELKVLNATTKGFILVKRAQLIRASDPAIGEILFQGVRTTVAQALIAE